MVLMSILKLEIKNITLVFSAAVDVRNEYCRQIQPIIKALDMF
jgi:hypothetical protein